MTLLKNDKLVKNIFLPQSSQGIRKVRENFNIITWRSLRFNCVPCGKSLLMFAVMLFAYIQIGYSQDIAIQKVILSGKDGGYANGKTWDSDLLKGKINLILYADPDKQKWVRPLIDKLDTISFSKDKLGITFILNIDATIIPGFIIGKKLKHKSKTSKNIQYVLDQNKNLVKKWRIKDHNVNILILDKSNEILYEHFGKITQNETDNIIKIINKLLKTGGNYAEQTN